MPIAAADDLGFRLRAISQYIVIQLTIDQDEVISNSKMGINNKERNKIKLCISVWYNQKSNGNTKRNRAAAHGDNSDLSLLVNTSLFDIRMVDVRNKHSFPYSPFGPWLGGMWKFGDHFLKNEFLRRFWTQCLRCDFSVNNMSQGVRERMTQQADLNVLVKYPSVDHYLQLWGNPENDHLKSGFNVSTAANLV